MTLRTIRRRLIALGCALLVTFAAIPSGAPSGDAALTPVEVGIDRSNMGTEWTLSPPADPNIYPFNGPYHGPDVFEARRTAIFDGVARTHAHWFRDGFGADSTTDANLFVDEVTQIHARGMKFLAVVGPTGTDFAKQDEIPGNPSVNGCRWSTAPLSKIDLARFAHRVRTHFDALKAAGQSVDAVEVGNELDLYCNDADMPMISAFNAHGWKWFLTSAQVHAFDAGYAPFLQTFAGLIREYFPHAKIITFGMSNPTGNSAPLIAGLVNFRDASGKTFDYTRLVDGYGTHIYPPSDTTLHLVENATADLIAQAATLPHQDEKPLWITEWSEAASAFWASHTWYFQYDAHGNIGGDLNKAASPYPAMTRAQAIRAFDTDVIERLRSQPNPVNISTLMYYSYDSEGKSAMCDDTAFNKSRAIAGACYNGVIDPVTGALLPDVVAAISRP